MATKQDHSRKSYSGQRLALENDPRLLAIPPAGLSGQVLAKTGGGDYVTSWVTPAGGGGGGLTPTAVQTTNYAATSGQLVLVDAGGGNVQVTLPSAAAGATAGASVAVKRLDASMVTAVTVTATPATIDNDPTLTLIGAGSGATLINDGTNWQVSGTAILAAGTDSVTALLAPVYRPGWWYDRRAGTGVTSATVGSVQAGTVQAGVCTYVPVYAHRALTIDQVGVMIGGLTATTGSTVRIGLYAMSTATGYPSGAPMWDSGAFALAGIAANTPAPQALAVPQTIPKGWSWFALGFNATAPGSLIGVPIANDVAPSPGWAAFPAYAALSTSSPGPRYFTETIANGILPAAANPVAGVTVGQLAPTVFYRVMS